MTKTDRLAWWREARFGMFIHWGLYAIPAGIWKGKDYAHVGEWIMKNAQIPVKEYEQLAGRFNPVKFDAEQWVQVAKNAGMKYLVITAKHHDGFAMFNSPNNKYNIAEATPYGKDPMKDLARACQKAGIKLCFYYSQYLDWNEPDGAGNNWDFPDEDGKDFAKYLRQKVKPQLRELLTNYGPIGLIWFDGTTETKSQSLDLKRFVHHLQPECLVNGRVGHGVGDYGSLGDNQFPTGKVKGDRETPATLNDTWGFKTRDHNWKSVETLLYLLANCASKGVNYLLNVGPTAEGIIPQASIVRLRKIGDWLKINGKAIYCAQASPYDSAFDWGWVTQKDGKLYLLFREWPQNGRFTLYGLCNKAHKAYLLENPGKGIRFTQVFDKSHRYSDVELFLPPQKPDKYISVVALDITGKAVVRPKNNIMMISIDTFIGADDINHGKITIWNPYVAALEGQIKIEAQPELRISMVDKVLILPGKSLTLPFKVQAVKPFDGERRVRFLLLKDGVILASYENRFLRKKNIAQILQPKRKIRLNGDRRDWEGIPGEKVDTIEHETHCLTNDKKQGWQGPADLSFTTHCAWDKNGLYLRIDVKDDKLTPPPENRRNVHYAWQYDCVEIFLGATSAQIDDLSKTTVQLLVVPSATEKISACKTIILDQGFNVAARFIGKKTAEGYMIEGWIRPKSGNKIKFKPGRIISLEVVVDDTDDLTDGSPRTRMALNSKRGSNPNDPINWRWVCLA